jgi:hypothetical protein
VDFADLDCEADLAAHEAFLCVPVLVHRREAVGEDELVLRRRHLRVGARLGGEVVDVCAIFPRDVAARVVGERGGILRKSSHVVAQVVVHRAQVVVAVGEQQLRLLVGDAGLCSRDRWG